MKVVELGTQDIESHMLIDKRERGWMKFSKRKSIESYSTFEPSARGLELF